MEKELAEIKSLLQKLIALELWRSGVSQGEIGKQLGVAKVTVNKMLKGVQREIAVKN